MLFLGMVCIASVAATSCKEVEKLPNTLTDDEKAEGWELLFDGKTTNGWHLYNMGTTQSAWIVVDDELYCKPDTFEVAHEDLVTDKTYANFDLQFEWKISTAGNSGVFINVQESPDNPKTWSSGPEYQLLDNQGIHKEYLHDSTHWAGCLYGFQPNQNPVTLKPSGQWNQSHIRQENGKVTFWLNGVQTAEEDFKSAHWKESVAKSVAFQTFPAYGKATEGHIALQDWAKGVSFRNLKIKRL